MRRITSVTYSKRDYRHDLRCADLNESGNLRDDDVATIRRGDATVDDVARHAVGIKYLLYHPLSRASLDTRIDSVPFRATLVHFTTRKHR